MGCCRIPKYTCSATLVGFMGVDWQKSGLNHEKWNPWFLPRWTPTKNFNIFDHYRIGKVLTDIFYVETLLPTCLVWALWLFEWTQLVFLAYAKTSLSPKTVVFNVAKSPSSGRFHALWGRFCDLRDLGGDFSFQEGDFCRLKHTQMFNWFQKNDICYSGIKAFDARSTP